MPIGLTIFAHLFKLLLPAKNILKFRKKYDIYLCKGLFELKLPKKGETCKVMVGPLRDKQSLPGLWRNCAVNNDCFAIGSTQSPEKWRPD